MELCAFLEGDKSRPLIIFGYFGPVVGRLEASFDQMTSVRPDAKPRVDVRPGALVRTASCHNTDVPSGDTEEFLVAAPYFGKYGL